MSTSKNFSQSTETLILAFNTSSEPDGSPVCGLYVGHMKIAVEAEVCTVVDKGEGRFHVLVKSAIWVLGLTTDRPPEARTVIIVEGERPEEEEPKDVYATVMANPKVGIAPRERWRYKYAELESASWARSETKLKDLWRKRRTRR